ncbi:ABC transporter permease [Actinocorallia sp. A-T 12471]|uniref:ABC transporter permease n=1 Tax=Actinocorallia sp. A-T 12471 TaxID=3089813 RepID=UPI0029CE03D7|nr:ABC transporter permease [Actinocorallia sp. A-T 12471]MDX6738308.1 ABC transporter permease [Actinocorallia sp. A-T 12471]
MVDPRSVLDIARESVEAILGRRVRSLLTVAGVAFGVLALVATVGLTSTAAAQVSSRFDALKATRVTVEGFTADGPSETTADGLLAPLVAPEALTRVGGLNGVVSAGTVAVSRDALPPVSKAGGRPSSAAVETAVMAVSPGAFDALGVEVVQGRALDPVHERERHRVVVLGDIAARTLGVDRVDGRSIVSIAGVPYLLVGIVTTPDFDSQAPLSAIVPAWVARDPWSRLAFGDPYVVIRTKAGAARQVGAEAKVALDPDRPGRLVAQVPPDPEQLRASVETDTRALFLAMAAVSLLIGAIGIGNTTLVAVLERRHEIGLRRAVGATRRSILTQFLCESGTLGLLGGAAGTLAGLDLTVGIALARDWTAAIPPWLIPAGPFTGLCVGLAAGAYPATKAAHLEPAQALTS